jgi:hypothetical protein
MARLDEISAAVSPGAERFAPRPRHAHRVPVAILGDLFSLEGERTALVLNLSISGAMVEMPLPPRTGAPVILHCGALEVEGEVVWQQPQLCGIRFLSPIDDAEVDCEALWSRFAVTRLLER